MMKENNSSEKRLGLLSIFGIRSGDKVALIGCGGKTSLMCALAEDARPRSVLLTTTTRILLPPAHLCDYVTDGQINGVKGGVHLFHGGECGGKLVAPEPERLKAAQRLFDYAFIEADGSKMRPLKGWAEYEPVVPDFVTATVAVATVAPVGEPVSEENTHRLPIFCELTGAAAGEAVTPAQIAAMISHPRGMLQKAAGKRIVYINRIESERDRSCAHEIFRLLPASVLQNVARVVIGSLRQNVFEVIWEGGHRDAKYL